MKKFIVPGSPVGYVTTTFRGKWNKNYKKFSDYAKEVRLHARSSGISIPLYADIDRPLIIRTVSYFKNKVHCDPGNVQKGVVDALFYNDKESFRMHKKNKGPGKGNDKYTGGSFPPPRYDKNNPRVVVIIKRCEPFKGRK